MLEIAFCKSIGIEYFVMVYEIQDFICSLIEVYESVVKRFRGGNVSLLVFKEILL
jgi:hypothetical protein